MWVYNIRKEKYAKQLIASGSANRWNKQDEFVIYAGSSRALATLELVVHRSGISTDQSYQLLVISIDVQEQDVEEIQLDKLPENWQSVRAYPVLQEIGSRWYQAKKTLLLKVPSAVIPKESNFLINTRHPDFNYRVQVIEIEQFIWDTRLL